MSLRSDIADVLKAELPAGKYRVLPYMRELDNSAARVVMVHRKKIARNRDRHALIDHDVVIHALVPETLGEAAEDAADACVDDVLGVLQQIDNLDWSEAERSTYTNFVGYEITVTATTPYLRPE